MSHSPEQLKTLFLKAKHGDQHAFSELFQEFYKPIYSYIFLRLRDREKTKDLTQDVFLKVYASLSRAYVADTSPLAYFYTVAKHALIDYFRKKKDVLVADEFFADIAYETTLEKETEQDLEMKRVMEAIKVLPEEQERALLLRFFEDRPYTYIARVLRKKEDTVRQLISRALKTLRKKLLL